jgi:short-subunit dehydrogenase
MTTDTLERPTTEVKLIKTVTLQVVLTAREVELLERLAGHLNVTKSRIWLETIDLVIDEETKS